MEKLFYSWDEQLKDTNEICELIEKDDFVPDVIVGISRGGLIPGVMISHKLNIPFKPKQMLSNHEFVVHILD